LTPLNTPDLYSLDETTNTVTVTMSEIELALIPPWLLRNYVWFNALVVPLYLFFIAETLTILSFNI